MTLHNTGTTSHHILDYSNDIYNSDYHQAATIAEFLRTSGVDTGATPEEYKYPSFKRATPNTGSFYDGGIASGPDTGYQATLHGTELVVSPKTFYPATLVNGGSTQAGANEEPITINLQIVTPDGDITEERVIKIARNEADHVVVARAKRGKTSDTRRYYN